MTSDEKRRFERLLKKYHNNSLSDEEYQVFISILDVEKMIVAESLDDMAGKDWEESLELLTRIRQEETDRVETGKKKLNIKWIWQGAAAVLLLGIAWFFWPQTQPEDLVFTTGYGEIKNIELPDGSIVLLNANSQISWTEGWKSSGYRKVELNGEAYFDVKHREDMPFEVSASGVKVDVLGTEFNIRDRGSETEVFLHQGKVNLKIDNKEETVEMLPGDFVRYDSVIEDLIIEKDHKLGKQAAWVDGMLDFENKPLEAILQEFGTLYGKEFKIENKDLAHKRMDFSLPYSDWELVKKALEIAIDAEFTETKDSVFIK